MRIAYVTFEYPPFIMGGAGIHGIHITKELARLGHHITIFTPAISDSVSDSEDNPRIELIRVPVMQKLPFKALQFWLRLPKEIRRIEKKKRFDIIHFNGISYCFHKKRIAFAPHIVTIHHLVKDTIDNNNKKCYSRLINISGETGFFLPIFEKRAIRSADKIIAVSKFTRDQIIQTYHLDPSKIDVIYNGVDQSGYNFSQIELDIIKQRYAIQDIPIVLFVGRIDDPRKGLNTLIEAFKLVFESLDAQLLVVGSGVPKVQRNLSESLSQRIIYTGYVDEETLKKCYSLSDVYVCPSRLEGFGLTILEAFAAGKPVVATYVGAIPELIYQGKEGILVEKDDISGMANAILYFLRKTYHEMTNASANSLSIDEKFSWKKSAKDLEKTYKQMGNL